MNLNVITLIFKILMVLSPVWDKVLDLIADLAIEDREDLVAAVNHLSNLPTFKA